MTRKIITVLLILSLMILTPLMAFSEEKEMTSR